ncbi:hypothetical protein BTUL_0051g00170 [Botrytis tulipae]|uniref:Uncharacterized protein n=1 Tax=Botrytis tulipae TaxID=87230 RepID=A0A4Z1EUN9_9HELO|nr:hypothetical protein BTUL_0051g00170 [Botrytis tulipae]
MLKFEICLDQELHLPRTLRIYCCLKLTLSSRRTMELMNPDGGSTGLDNVVFVKRIRETTKEKYNDAAEASDVAFFQFISFSKV